MGGQEGLRGYLFQALICLLDAVRNENKWITVALEPDLASDKVDILWTYDAHTKATQVKSSKNSFDLPDVKRWANDLQHSIKADQYELLLIGPCSAGAARQHSFGKVLIPPPYQLNIEALLDQASHKLDKYLDSQNLPSPSASARELIVNGLTSRLAAWAINSKALTRDNFNQLLTNWISEIKSPHHPNTSQTVNSFPAPHQLPLPPADFTGRQQELGTLVSLPHNSSTQIIAIRGMGGIGKTAFALKLADSLLSSFPDAQLFIDLKGATSSPLSPQQALTHIIRSFSPDIPIEDELGINTLYRSLLHGKRVLLLADNALSSSQIEPLLPPPGSLIIYTSRQHFTVPGQTSLDLESLSDPDASTLLQKISPRIGEHASILAKLCANIPLTLRLAGSLLAERLDVSPTQYIAKLRDSKERTALIQASLELSYNILDQPLKDFFRRLSVFPGEILALGAGEVCQTATSEAEESLGKLLLYSLIEWNPKTHHYKLHDLVRPFAEQLLSPAEHLDSHRRHAEYGLRLLMTSAAFYERGGDNMLLGLKIVEDDWDTIHSGFHWAERNAPNDKDAADICSRYSTSGIYCLNFFLTPEMRLSWHKSSLAASRITQNESVELACLTNIADTYAEMGTAHQAIAHAEEALELSRKLNDQEAELSILGTLGVAFSKLGERPKAIEYLTNQLTLAKHLKNARSQISSLGNLSNIHLAGNDTASAISHLKEALELGQGIKDHLLEGAILRKLGMLYTTTGQNKEAVALLRKGLYLARKFKDEQAEGEVLFDLGNAYTALGNVRRATVLHTHSISTLKKEGDPLLAASSSWNLGVLYLEQENRERALDAMKYCVDTLRTLAHPDYERRKDQLDHLLENPKE